MKNSMGSLDVISSEQAVTLPGLFHQRVARCPAAIAYQQYDSRNGGWQDYTWQEMATRIARWQAALNKEGLTAGDRVAILLHNSVEWVCFEQAALALGLVVVPLYTTDTPDNIAYILADSGARLLLAGELLQWQALANHSQDLSCLQRVLYLEGESPGAEDPVLRRVETWLGGVTDIAPPVHVNQPGDLATLIYTSGTTGAPKGVMLSHHNILANAEAVLKATPAYPEDVFLSFLPLSHAFERTVGYYIPMMAGSRVAYSRSVKELPEDLAMIRPTVLVSVPRIYERVYAKVWEKLEQEGALARFLLRKAVQIGWEHFEASQGRLARIGLLHRLSWPLLRKLVAGKILARLGGRLRIAVSGGAPLAERIGEFFLGLGVPLLQGYGLTEAAPVVSGNLLEANEPASVGKPLPGIELAFGDMEELLVRSSCIMLGYWNHEEATQQAIDEDGWLHTGDVAEMRDEYLYIRGRLKEIIVTSTGEKAAPADMELAITLGPLFEQAMVVGEGRPFLGALLVLHPAAWQSLAASLDLDPAAPASLQEPVVTEAVLEKLAEALHAFPAWAQVHAVYLTLEPWTIENSLLTPTMKLKRTQLQDRFGAQIEQLYAGHAAAG
jgi:long-chain acyl-CoA synthetase